MVQLIDKNESILVEDLPFDIPDNWSFIRLENALIYEQPTEYIVDSTDYNNTYPIPVLTAGKSFIIGYTNEEYGIKTDLPVIIFDDFTTDSKYVDFPFKVKSSAMKILRTKGEININYIAYYMSITRLIGDTHKRYWISEYSKLLIPIPPYQEQLRIVDTIQTIFDKIHKITAELS
jgi:type I restriction enzyme S subunit